METINGLAVMVKDNLRKIEVRFDNTTATTPRQAITTTNLNHSEKVDYKTPFLEIFIEDFDNLKTMSGYAKEVYKAKKWIQKNKKKFLYLL